MKDTAEEMRLIGRKKQKIEKETREAIKNFGEQKRDEFWKKLNNDIRKEKEEKFRRILCEIKTEVEREGGKTELLFNLGGEGRENRYDARDSKAMLNEICDEEIRELGTGKNMNIERCFDSVFENSCDIKLNLLSEKLIDLIKKEGFEAQKNLSEYTETGGWEDISGPSFTWHLFGIKISW